MIGAALALVVAACGPGETTDPYGVLDRAITAGWQQVTVNVGFSVDVAAQQQDGVPIPATSIKVDPSAIAFTVDTTTGKARLALSVPLQALGMEPSALGPLGLLIQSVDGELLFDGESLFAKSALIPMYLQGVGGQLGGPIKGDLTGWVRLGSKSELDALGGGTTVLGSLFGAGALPGNLVLPSPGAPASLQAFVEDFGVAATFVGSDSADGVETQHVSGVVNLAKLAESRQLAAFTGFGRDQLQGIFDASKQVTVTADVWIDKGTGRLRTFRLDFNTLAEPVAKVSIVLQLRDPAAGTTFDAPAHFTDVPIVGLLGGPVGAPGTPIDGGATPAPLNPSGYTDGTPSEPQ